MTMNNYTVRGKRMHRGIAEPVTVTIKATNDKVARVKATEYMHMIDSVREGTK